MTFVQKQIDGVLVLAPRKNLVGGDETYALLTAIEHAAADRPAKVIMDLTGVKWVSSLGVGLLRKASMTCDHSGGWLRLACIGKSIENTLLVTGLVIYFETFETVDAAVAAPEKKSHRVAGQNRPNDQPKRPDAGQ